MEEPSNWKCGWVRVDDDNWMVIYKLTIFPKDKNALQQSMLCLNSMPRAISSKIRRFWYKKLTAGDIKKKSMAFILMRIELFFCYTNKTKDESCFCVCFITIIFQIRKSYKDTERLKNLNISLQHGYGKVSCKNNYSKSPRNLPHICTAFYSRF